VTGVALTFDDGPDPTWTPALLDALAAAGAVATFFVLGPAMVANPELVRRTVAEGHAVELHGWAHLRHPSSPKTVVAEDTARALDALEALAVYPRWWRLPWGLAAGWTPPLAASHELTIAGWTADTLDWRGLSAERMLERVAPAVVAPDAIVLAHDGLGPGAKRDGAEETVRLVEPLVAAVRAAGHEPVLLDALDTVTTERGGSATAG
jgi:peptidoglycan-N-acetylglucosamine deacetylase